MRKRERWIRKQTALLPSGNVSVTQSSAFKKESRIYSARRSFQGGANVVLYIILIGLVVSVLLYNIALGRTTEELYELFSDDEERWWHHREIEQALGRRELLVTHALRRIGKETGIVTKFLYLGGIEQQIPGGKLSRGIFVAFYRLKRGGGGGKKRRVSKPIQVRRSGGAPVYT